eukprot:gene15414-biopygen17182
MCANILAFLNIVVPNQYFQTCCTMVLYKAAKCSFPSVPSSPAAKPAAKPAVKGPAAAVAGPPRRRAASLLLQRLPRGGLVAQGAAVY